VTAPGGRLGAAFVRIRADASRFAREARRSINNGLADIEDYLTRGRFPNAVRRAGAQAGRDFARMFNLFARNINIDIDRDKLAKFGLQFLKITGAIGGAANALATMPALISAVGAALATIGGAAAATLPALIAGFVAVSQTLKLAFKGVGEAFKAIAEDDADALNEALKKLSPSAQAFVKEIAEARPKFKLLQQQIQESFFAPLKGGFAELVNTGIFKTLRVQMSGIAEDAGFVARQLLRVLSGAQEQGTLTVILENVRKQFQNIASLLPHVARAFLEVAKAAAPFLTEMTAGLSTIVEEGLQKLVAFAKGGGIADLFNNAFDIIVAVGSALKDIVAIVGTVFGSLLAGADGAAGPLASILASVRGFVESREGAQALEELGRAFQAVGNLVTAVLKPLLPVAGRIIAMLAGPLASTLERLVRPIQRLAEDFAVLFGHILDAAGPIIDKLIDVLTEFAVQVLGLVAKHIEELTPVLTALLTELGPHMIPIVEALGEVLLAFLPLLPAFTEILVELAPAIIDLIPLMIFMAKVTTVLWQGIAIVIRFLAELLGWIGKLVGSQLKAYLMFINWVMETAWPAIFSAIRDFFVGWFNFFITNWTNLLGFISNAVTNIGDWISDLPRKIGAGLASLGSALATPFINGFNWVRNFINTSIGQIMNGIASIPGRILSFVGTIYNAAVNLGRAIGNGIANIPGFAVDVASRIVNAIRGFANNVIGSINSGIARLDNLIPFSLPRIPFLARGAIVDSPTLAVIGERGREVVLPLNNPRRAQQLAEESGLLGMLRGFGDQAPPTVNVYFGDELINERVQVLIRRFSRIQAREVAFGSRGF
jgi:hypothetical protein